MDRRSSTSTPRDSHAVAGRSGSRAGPRTSSPAGRTPFARGARTLGEWRTFRLPLFVFLLGVGASSAVFFVVDGRSKSRQRAAFTADASAVVSNLRAAFGLPLEVLESTAALFEASQGVSRAEFARFVEPALERHQSLRALEWIPIVPADQRASYEARARADGLSGFQFRQQGAGGMVAASPRDEYLPIFYMEPSHPLVLGFDCASEPQRQEAAQRARTRAKAVASPRIRLLEDPPTVYSVAVFQPVFDPTQVKSSQAVRGFTCEVFRVRAIAERAITDSLRLGIDIVLIDLDAPKETQVLFESAARKDTSADALRLESDLSFADRRWRIVLSTLPNYRSELASPAWLSLSCGLGLSLLIALALSTLRLMARLREQVLAGQKLGPYTLTEELGHGAVGVVYKAQHALLRRPTAVKLLAEPSPDPVQQARFEREVQLTSELTHPNTIAIYDYGRTAEGTFYYAMEYVAGITLEQLIQHTGALPPVRAVHLLAQACQAIAEAHDAGLVHRDIKPANIMICRRGGIPDFVKVMDFGLVKDLGTGRARANRAEIMHSASTNVVGTPLYLAPEAIARPNEVDARTDIYALGAVAYYLIVGEPVFDGQTIVEVCAKHLTEPPPRPSKSAPQPIPEELEQIMLRCLEKEPKDRFQSMAELLTALRLVPGLGPWREEEARAWWNDLGDSLVTKLQNEQRTPLSTEISAGERLSTAPRGVTL